MCLRIQLGYRITKRFKNADDVKSFAKLKSHAAAYVVIETPKTHSQEPTLTVFELQQ